MPISPLETAGAQIQPTSAAPLHTNEFFTGLWTHGNPLGPGAVPFLYQRFYSAARYDRFIAGLNIEISTQLTPIRRPGSSVYNAGPFPVISRFYEFRSFTTAGEKIHIIADCEAGTGSATASVREVTQPSTNNILWDHAAGRTSFVSDGNTLYAGDGVSTHKWVTAALSWQPNSYYNTGDFIVDPNGNLQMAVGSQLGQIINIQVTASGSQWQYTVWLAAPLTLRNNVRLGFNGLTTVPSINGQSIPVQVDSPVQVHWLSSSGPAVAYSTETGTAGTGTNNSGPTPPAWQTTPGQVTGDGGTYWMQWVNIGPSVQPWGGAGPANAPTVTQAAAATLYPAWAANTWYAPLFIILDSNNNLQQLTGPAPPIKTGNAAPVWATTPGAITTEGGGGGSNAQWTCKGPGTWTASATHAVGDLIVATYTYYVTSTYFDHSVKQWITTTTAITTTSVFTCTVAGVSGATVPAWNNGILTTTQDGSVTWQNGGTAPGWPGGNQLLSLATTILDSLGNAQMVQNLGESGATAPTWQSAPGATTTDHQINWLNNGPYSAANTGAWIWAYSGFNTITGEITNPSPLSQPLITSAGMHPVLQGQGLGNPPWDQLILWRTQQGGSTLLYEDQFPNPGAGATWIYTDTNADSALNQQFPAPVPGLNGNDPPPQDFVPKCYYLGRIWGFENNKLLWTGGPDTVTGAGNSTMPTKNRFTLTAAGVLCWPTSVGLLVFTTSDIWAVLGQGTPNSPFYIIQFQQGIGMASQDAFAVNGSTAYAMISSHQVLSMDPGAGEVEVGFPLGNLFDDDYDPGQVYLAWHQGLSKDSALYVADGSAGWYRMAAVAAPESGNVWSPQAIIASPGKLKAIASIETSPGNKILVLGPSVDGNPILMRDNSTNADAGVNYDAYGVVSSVVLAQPGGTAGLQFVVTEEKMIAGATPIVCKILFDEILFGSPDITLADFRQLRNVTPDPPNLPPQKSVRTQRHWAAQDANTVIKCRHYQQQLVWAAENFPNELYTNTIYGRLPEKARK